MHTVYNLVTVFRDKIHHVHVCGHYYTLSYIQLLTHQPIQVAREGSYTADPYVKVYLHPDPNKTTKQKTKVAKRTLHPTYNETVS